MFSFPHFLYPINRYIALMALIISLSSEYSKNRKKIERFCIRTWLLHLGKIFDSDELQQYSKFINLRYLFLAFIAHVLQIFRPGVL